MGRLAFRRFSRGLQRRKSLLANENDHRAIDFNITDGSGHSITKRSLYLSPPKQKRVVSLRIDSCPDPADPYFIKSTCDHTGGSLNSQSYTLTCNTRPVSSPNYRTVNDVVTTGSCAAEEFCVENDHDPDATSVAYCVSPENLVQLIQAGSSAEAGSRQATLDTTTGSAHNIVGNTLDVVMLTPDTHSVVTADSISVSALAKDTINGQDSYRAQVGGTASCSACSSLQLATVPELTAQLRWDFVFHGVTGGAVLDVVHWGST